MYSRNYFADGRQEDFTSLTKFDYTFQAQNFCEEEDQNFQTYFTSASTMAAMRAISRLRFNSRPLESTAAAL
jgi:hypothetical protein